MRAYLFEVPGRDDVLALVYSRGSTRVFSTGIEDRSPNGAAIELDFTQANRDEEAWGRLILEKRQGDRAPRLRRVTGGLSLGQGDLAYVEGMG